MAGWAGADSERLSERSRGGLVEGPYRKAK